jgi:polysulfide reductase chain B
MKQLSLMVDLNRCIGCRTCIVACRNHKEIIDHSTAMPNKIPHFLRVESRISGTYPNLALDTWIVPCQHCFDPNCAANCPEGAITKDTQTGIVRIDKDLCTGCGNCIEFCPHGVIQFDHDAGVCYKCDLCFDRIHLGEIPVCAEVCMTNALSFGEYELMKQKARDAGRVILEDLSKESTLYIK